MNRKQYHLGPKINAKAAAADLATMEALVSGDSRQEISEQFHVHKQTLMFRKNKLEKMLGVDLTEPETRINLGIALKLRSILA